MDEPGGKAESPAEALLEGLDRCRFVLTDGVFVAATGFDLLDHGTAAVLRPIPGEVIEGGGVLTSDFRVHGTRGLRVVDASVFPRIPGFFPVSSIYMVAEKAADDILAQAGR